MSALTDLDPSYIKSVTALHSKDYLQNSKPLLQTYLEEAIKAKTGKDSNLTVMVQVLMKQSGVETFRASVEDSKVACTSDNELDLDMFLKEDLACVICQGMDVTARNRLLECTDCHSLYHQECHQPPVSQHDANNTWICVNCKDAKKARKSPVHVSLSSASSHSSSKSKSSSNSPRHLSSERSDRTDRGERSDRSSHSSGYKSSSSSSSKSGSKSSSSSGGNKSSSSSSSSSKSSSSKHTPVTTSSSIVSADKRLQNMKKKAAKLHEKKKLPR